MDSGKIDMYKTALYLLLAVIVAMLSVIFVPIEPSSVIQSNRTDVSIQGVSFNISATGTATVYLNPDEVTVTLGVETLDMNAQASQQQNTLAMNAVIDSLRGLGIHDDDIRTVTYSLTEQYDYTRETRVFAGYRTAHHVTVTSNDVKKAGLIIDSASKAGANYIGEINFGLQDETRRAALLQAVTEATRNAYVKAEASSKVFGADQLKPVNVRAEQDIIYPLFRESLVVDVQGASTEVSPGQVSVSATVTVDFHASDLGI
ncbi:MAG: SIMPL domain-containing protein [DPANN group archaeon]|nr:SIMPL domain-containing protein [DPANN group archaeon]